MPVMRTVCLAVGLLLCTCFEGAWGQAVRDDAVLLVAAPELSDPNFAQTVVLVVFPAEAGPLGVILNRPTRITLTEAFPDQPKLKRRSEALFFGGPVRPSGLVYLFRKEQGPLTAFPVIADLFLSADGPLLDSLLELPSPPVQRYFLGYAGWSPAQLDFEIAEGAWYVLPADLETILTMEPKTMWRQLLSRATAVKT